MFMTGCVVLMSRCHNKDISNNAYLHSKCHYWPKDS